MVRLLFKVQRVLSSFFLIIITERLPSAGARSLADPLHGVVSS